MNPYEIRNVLAKPVAVIVSSGRIMFGSVRSLPLTYCRWWRWCRHLYKCNLLWLRLWEIRTIGRLGLRFLVHKRLRMVWSATFTPVAVRNSCVNVRALSVRFLNWEFLWSCVVTLVHPDLALSHMELVALKWLKKYWNCARGNFKRTCNVPTG